MKASLRLRILLEEAVTRYARAVEDYYTDQPAEMPSESDFVEEIVRIVEQEGERG